MVNSQKDVVEQCPGSLLPRRVLHGRLCSRALPRSCTHALMTSSTLVYKDTKTNTSLNIGTKIHYWSVRGRGGVSRVGAWTLFCTHGLMMRNRMRNVRTRPTPAGVCDVADAVDDEDEVSRGQAEQVPDAVHEAVGLARVHGARRHEDAHQDGEVQRRHGHRQVHADVCKGTHGYIHIYIHKHMKTNTRKREHVNSRVRTLY